MLQAVGKLITTRRNFLIRASAITAAGATVAVPVVALASAEDRIRHHMAGLKQAVADRYGGAIFARWSEQQRCAIVLAEGGHLGADEIDAIMRRW